MVHVTQTDRSALMVTFDTEQGSATVANGKIRASIGFITPADYKKMMKVYHAIKKEWKTTNPITNENNTQTS